LSPTEKEVRSGTAQKIEGQLQNIKGGCRGNEKSDALFEEYLHSKKKLLSELESIEHQLVLNDGWLSRAAKTGDAALDFVERHRRMGQVLITRGREIREHLLPKIESQIEELLKEKEEVESLCDEDGFFNMKEGETSGSPSLSQKKPYVEGHASSALERLSQENAVNETMNRSITHPSGRNQDKKYNDHAKGEIKKHARKRRIMRLVHFTQSGNLPCISKHGLYSRRLLETKGVRFNPSDEGRFDRRLDWVSISISFPNYKMFYSKRQNLQGEWMVLWIKPEVLWELDCTFYYTNAARLNTSRYQMEDWRSCEAFEKMFGFKMHRGDIPDCYTTDPQAEVMVRDHIPLEFIQKVIVLNKCEAEELKKITDIPVEVDSFFFDGRRDYEYWQNFFLE
jgi:hypothetical protein